MQADCIFETILFINHLPCYYKVLHLNGYYIYEPVPHHFYNSVVFPELVVNRSHGEWKVIGLQDKNIIGPLIHELESHLPSFQQ